MAVLSSAFPDDCLGLSNGNPGWGGACAVAAAQDSTQSLRQEIQQGILCYHSNLNILLV